MLITSRHEKLTPILLTPDPGDDPQLGKGRGYTNFYRWVFFFLGWGWAGVGWWIGGSMDWRRRCVLGYD